MLGVRGGYRDKLAPPLSVSRGSFSKRAACQERTVLLRQFFPAAFRNHPRTAGVIEEIAGASAFRRYQVMQPVAVNGSRRSLPSTPQRFGDLRLRKTCHEVLAPIGNNSNFESSQKFSGRTIEISVRHCRIRLPFPPQKPLDVSPVFFEQSPRAVLRMTLEMHEEAVFPFLHK